MNCDCRPRTSEDDGWWWLHMKKLQREVNVFRGAFGPSRRVFNFMICITARDLSEKGLSGEKLNKHQSLATKNQRDSDSSGFKASRNNVGKKRSVYGSLNWSSCQATAKILSLRKTHRCHHLCCCRWGRSKKHVPMDTQTVPNAIYCALVTSARWERKIYGEKPRASLALDESRLVAILFRHFHGPKTKTSAELHAPEKCLHRDH